MKRALLDLVQDVAGFLAMAAFLAFATYGTAGLSLAMRAVQ